MRLAATVPIALSLLVSCGQQKALNNGASQITQAVPMKACEKCRTNAALVHVSRADSEAEATTPTVATNLCEFCAKEFIQTTPQRERLIFSADFRPAERHQRITRECRIVYVDHSTNTTEIEVFDGGVAPVNRIPLQIRTDLVPRAVRLAGAKFQLVGTPLEIELIETSAPKTAR